MNRCRGRYHVRANSVRLGLLRHGGRGCKLFDGAEQRGLRQPHNAMPHRHPRALTARGVRAPLVGGCTASGCVRASAVDAMSWGVRPIVVEDCVGDRALGAHHANPSDMRSKYADVDPWNVVAKSIGVRA